MASTAKAIDESGDFPLGLTDLGARILDAVNHWQVDGVVIDGTETHPLPMTLVCHDGIPQILITNALPLGNQRRMVASELRNLVSIDYLRCEKMIPAELLSRLAWMQMAGCTGSYSTTDSGALARVWVEPRKSDGALTVVRATRADMGDLQPSFMRADFERELYRITPRGKRALLQWKASNPTASKPKKGTKRGPGRPQLTDEEVAVYQSIYDAWATGAYPTYEALGRELGYKRKFIKKAVGYIREKIRESESA